MPNFYTTKKFAKVARSANSFEIDLRGKGLPTSVMLVFILTHQIQAAYPYKIKSHYYCAIIIHCSRCTDLWRRL